LAIGTSPPELFRPVVAGGTDDAAILRRQRRLLATIEPDVVRLPPQHDPPDIDIASLRNSLHGPEYRKAMLLLDGTCAENLAAEVVG